MSLVFIISFYVTVGSFLSPYNVASYISHCIMKEAHPILNNDLCIVCNPKMISKFYNLKCFTDFTI